MTATGKILVVGPSWVGDMVMAGSLYRLLKRLEPPPTIHVLAPPWSRAVLARIPEVDRGIDMPLGHGQLGLGARMRLGRTLAGEAYEQAIVLPHSFKAALVPWFAGIPRRTGYRGEWRYGLINDTRAFDPRLLDQTVKRFVALGRPAGQPLPPELPRPALRVEPANLEAVRRRLGLTPGRAVALMPGAAYGPAKRWPLERYAALARRLVDDGSEVWVLGSKKEADFGRTLCALAGDDGVANLCGETTLADVIDLLSAAAIAVTNDSGLMHVAAAVGTHVVAIYGSSSPRFTPPLTDERTILYMHLDCSPCFERECPLEHLQCMRGISVDQVRAAVARSLTGPAAAAADAGLCSSGRGA